MAETKEVKGKEAPEPLLGEKHLLSSLVEVEQEINTGYRVIKLLNFRGEKEAKIHIQVPTVEIDAECSRIYAEHYNSILFSDKKIPTREEMLDKMKSRGIWTKEDDDKVEDIDDRVKDLMREGQEMHYKKRVNKKRLQELKDQMRSLRDDKTRLEAKRNNMLSQTIDSLSDLISLEYKLFRCATDVENKPLWDTWEDFKKEKNRNVLGQLLKEGMIFWNGLPQDILELLPEDIALQGVLSEQ